MYTGHPFALVVVGYGAAAVATAEDARTIAVVGLVVVLLGACWDWFRVDDDPPGERIASSLVGGVVGITALVLALAYRPRWSLAALAFLAFLPTEGVSAARSQQ